LGGESEIFLEASKMVANLLLVLIEYQFKQVKMSMCNFQGQFVFTFPFGVKIDTIKIDVFFNLQRKVAWRELKTMVTSSNPCKTRKQCEEPFN